MSNLSSGNSSDESTEEAHDGSSVHQEQAALPNKKRRKLPGNPDPSADVVALSPETLMAKNRFVCEVCNKGFQREQNLQLHRRGHNLPWKLKQKTSTEIKKRVYICPEPSCIHHNPARALGDLTGIKKHYSRKHGEKKWKCDKCSKKYAVQSDWKAHSKTCGTKEYKCDCGTIFSRRDSFVTHRAFCDALAEENNKVNQTLTSTTVSNSPEIRNSNMKSPLRPLPQELTQTPPRPLNMAGISMFANPRNLSSSSFAGFQLGTNSSNMSATALLQQAAQMGATVSSSMNTPLLMQKGYPSLFNGMQVPIQSDHDQTPIGSSLHGFVGSILQNGTEETFSELLLDSSTSGDHEKTSRMLNEGWYNNGLFNEKQRLLNKEDHGNNLAKINGESTGNDSLTLDFLGIGRNFNDMHDQQQQELSFKQKVSQQNIQELNSIWDV